MDNEFVYELTGKDIDELLAESSVNYPMLDLDSSIWTKVNETYTLNTKVKNKILTFISKNPHWQEMESIVEDIRIVGSITTNLYTDETDIDVHTILKHELGGNGLLEVKEWAQNHSKYINDHPIELHVHTDPNQGMLSTGVYSIMQEKWLTKPMLVNCDTITPQEADRIESELGVVK